MGLLISTNGDVDAKKERDPARDVLTQERGKDGGREIVSSIMP